MADALVVAAGEVFQEHVVGAVIVQGAAVEAEPRDDGVRDDGEPLPELVNEAEDIIILKLVVEKHFPSVVVLTVQSVHVLSAQNLYVIVLPLYVTIWD